MVGSALKLKPILTIEGGSVVPVGRVRTRPKAIENLIDRAAALRPIEQIVVIHATTPEDLDYVVGRLRGLAPDASLVTGTLGPVLGVHTGPGTIAVVTVSSAPKGPRPRAASAPTRLLPPLGPLPPSTPGRRHGDLPDRPPAAHSLR